MSSSSNTREMVGQLLEGKYRLQREVGAGGMGQVFLAHHETIERPVAIKVLHRELASDEAVRRRFETEAKAIARLRHPNCVLLYEFGYSDEIEALFAVFEYVEGASLEEWVGKQLPIADVLKVGMQVSSGIAHAHDQKIIHRDLKPENIMVVGGEEELLVKVLDFGIARIAEDDEKNTRLTQMGQMFGTPPYMSPEQVRAKLNVTFATDIYAIGVILYEMLEGRLPFMGDTPIETVMMHLNDEVPPMTREDLPDELKEIVMRCLSKDARDRYGSCKELEKVLRGVVWESDEPTALTVDLEEIQKEDRAAMDQFVSAPTLVAEDSPTQQEIDPAGLGDGSPEHDKATDQEVWARDIPTEETNGDSSFTGVAPGTGEPGQAGDRSKEKIETYYGDTDKRRRLVMMALLILLLVGAVVGMVAFLTFGADDGERGETQVQAEAGSAGEVEVERAGDEDSDREVPQVGLADGLTEEVDEEEEEEEKLALDQDDEYREEESEEDDQSEELAEDPPPSPQPEVRQATTPRQADRPRRPPPQTEPEADQEQAGSAEQPDALRLDRRRRQRDEQQEEAEREEPTGIGLPQRD